MIEEIIKATFPLLKKSREGEFKLVEDDLDLLGIEFDKEEILQAFAIVSSSKNIEEALKACGTNASEAIKKAEDIIKQQKNERVKKEEDAIKDAIKKEAEEKLLKEQKKAFNYLYSIDDYIICEGRSCDELKKNVRDCMERGYVPYGGVSTYNPGGKLGGVPNSFFQAMVSLKRD